MTPKAQQTKATVHKWDYIKVKTLYIKGHNEQSERQTMDWEKIFAYHTSDKRLISRIYK